jgi:eukaryotic-like serine/threonine-protein kinase
MGTVWIADDPVLSRRVAVKVLRSDLAADDATRARFRNEAIAAARVNHPNIVATYDTGDDNGTAYIVMELVDGPTVRRLVDEHGPLPVQDAIRIGVEVAAALDAAHGAGLVHRDVKPPNVLVPQSGPVKVTDFGIAKATGDDDLTRTGAVMGTARYLAPEQVSGEPADARTDVYALGLLLYEMLCGAPPFGGETDVATAMARLTTTAPPIRLQRADVPPALDDIVHRCLARDRARRYPSAGDVRDALARVPIDRYVAPSVVPRPPSAPAAARTARPAPHPAKAPSRARARRRRSSAATWIWVGIVFLLAAAIGVAAFLVLKDDNKSNGSSTSAPARAALDAAEVALA